MGRKLLPILLALSCLAMLTGTAQAAAPSLSAQAAVLLDAESGQVLYQLNADARMYPASTTKVLTALVALEHAKLTDKVSVSQTAVTLPPDSSLAGLKPGEQLTMEDLLYGLLLPSGNDAAVAIAEHVAGSEAAFAELMNKKAAELGATHSHFANASGLHDPTHYTTANDLGLITLAAYRNPDIMRISTVDNYMLPGNRQLINHNGLLGYYQGEVAGKTGFTEQAGHTLVTQVHRGDRTLIGVVMKTQPLYTDMMRLLDYGFNNFTLLPLVKKGDVIAKVPIADGSAPDLDAVAANGASYSIPTGAKVASTAQPNLQSDLHAPISPGQKVGELVLRVDDKVVRKVDLVANRGIGYVPKVRQVTERVVAAWSRPLPISLTFMTGLMSAAVLRLRWVARRRRQRRRLPAAIPRVNYYRGYRQ